jgi:Tfp pilus assembly protein PilN
MLYLFLLTTLGFAAATYYYFQQFQQSQTSQRQLKERIGKLEREQKQIKQTYSKYDDLVSKEAFINKLDLDISLTYIQQVFWAKKYLPRKSEGFRDHILNSKFFIEN